MKKVFCLGLHKTGTATFREAVKILGYTKFSDSKDKFLKNIKANDWQPIFDYVKEYDALKAWPWAIIYKELDKEFPGSKFVLTTRDHRRWIKSAIRHFGYRDTPMRKYIFGTGHPKGNESEHIRVLNNHTIDVMNYFLETPKKSKQLLVVNWEAGDGWKELCAFLKKPIPNVPFPWANKHKGKYGDLV